MEPNRDHNTEPLIDGLHLDLTFFFVVVAVVAVSLAPVAAIVVVQTFSEAPTKAEHVKIFDNKYQ